MHVWAQVDEATEGCTAMAKDDLNEIILWLNPMRSILVALPRPVYDELHAEWMLPPGL